MRASLFFLVFLGCGSEGNLALRTPKLELDVLSPTYGQFLGDGPVVVEGRINEPLATVTVEGRPVDVDAEGRFVTSVPLDYAYRIVDVEAELFGAWTRERVPVFQGQDPLLSWPGGLTVRLTAEGLGRLGEVVGSTIDQTGWDASLLAALPSVDNELFALTPTALTHDPTVVVLTPVDGGVDTAISLRNVAVEMELSIPALGWSVPLSVGYERIEVGALAVPLVDDEGMLSLELTESTVDLADPVFSVAEMEIDLLALALEAASWVVEPIGELVLDLVLGAVGVVPLGGPYVFEADLLGTPIEIRLTEVWGDPWGLGGELAVGLGEPAALLPLDIPAPTAVPPGADLALGLHEGLLQLVVEGAMLGLLEQDIQLGGIMGELIGNGVRALPGGDDAPDGDGWCMSVAPGEARVVRLQDGISPLAVLYLPDFQVDIGVLQGWACDEWLVASLAVEVGLSMRGGTELGMGLQVREGAVLSYGAKDWDEDEVVEGLGSFVESSVGLLGSQFSFDLADLAGGLSIDGLGGVSPEVLGSASLDGEGAPEGLYAISLSLWDDQPE